MTDEETEGLPMVCAAGELLRREWGVLHPETRDSVASRKLVVGDSE